MAINGKPWTRFSQQLLCSVLWAFGFFAVFCLSQRDAAAASALIVEPQLEGELSKDDVTLLRHTTESALKSQQLSLIPAGDLEATLSGEAQLQGCHTELCYERLGRLLDSQLVTRYRVKRGSGEGKAATAWKLSVEILDVEVGAMGAKLTEECAACTDKQAAEKLGDMVKRAVIECVARPRGGLEVRSEPSGAAVFVDGTELGITPYKRVTFAGSHKVVLRHVGFRSEQVDVVVEDGQKQGGFGSAVLEYIGTKHNRTTDVHIHGIDDVFVDHGTQEELWHDLGLDGEGIAAVVKEFIGFPQHLDTAELVG